MGKLIYLDDHRFPRWREVLSADSASSRLQAFVNDSTGEVEVIQANLEGEAITTVLSAASAARLVEALAAPVRAHK